MSGWANYFHLGAGRPGVQGGGQARHEAAAPVALSEARDEVQEVRALLGREAGEATRPPLPGAEDQGPSVGEGMISSESPVLENGTPGFDERG